MSTSSDTAPVRRALVSVSDKTGIVELARELEGHGIEILSTGGSARLLAEHGVAVQQVSDYTGFPEIMGGRVKTLHPRVHGGLLGRRGTDDASMREHDIPPIDLLVVNLYPFEAAVARAGTTFAEAIENIDIGGPAMIRGAAKNHAGVGVVTDAADYPRVTEALAEDGGLPSTLRLELAVKAFRHTAAYDAAIADYLTTAAGAGNEFPATFGGRYRRVQTLRYGENPHQRAAFYREPASDEASIATAEQLQGKPLSYNNIADADAALECVRCFDQPACVIVKHANPCGVAVAETVSTAYERAFATDPESAFGGIIAFNRALDAATVQAVLDRQFVEVIVAPAVAREALALTARRRNLRLLACGDLGSGTDEGLDLKRVRGGLLLQDADGALLPADAPEPTVVTRRAPEPAERADLAFAWCVAKFVKSNAICFAGQGRTLGIGAGQMSRVDSVRIGSAKAEAAGLSLDGAVLASDAFFPFRDGIDRIARAGVKAVIQPGGSVRDREIIDAADEHGIAMLVTGMRHFRH